ncbi:MAG: TerC family protein [Cyanobium sp.]|jgi:YkoY family integral membrane protein
MHDVAPVFAALEAGSLDSVAPLIQAADQWSEVLFLLPLLVALEAVLSADNAIALAAISRRLEDPALQRRALNLGLALALVFRLLLVLAARWVLHFPPLQLLASAYLLWLCGSHFVHLGGASAEEEERADAEEGPSEGEAAVRSLLPVVATLAFTDLAFSLDSVAAAVAVSNRLALVMAGGVIGVIALRLTAELFIRWLGIYRHLESAGYLAVGLVGIRLLLRVIVPQIDPPEWSLLAVVAALFTWGFSQKAPEEEPSSSGE